MRRKLRSRIQVHSLKYEYNISFVIDIGNSCLLNGQSMVTQFQDLAFLSSVVLYFFHHKSYILVY